MRENLTAAPARTPGADGRKLGAPQAAHTTDGRKLGAPQATHTADGRKLGLRRATHTHDVEGTLGLAGMAWAAEAMPDQLSAGQRKLVGVARALAARPRLLCLDEPAAGLDTRESGELGQCLRALADRGQSTLLIDHDMGLVLSVYDRVVVLEFGRVIADGPPEAVRRDPRVIAAYLGAGGQLAAATGPPGPASTDDPG